MLKKKNKKIRNYITFINYAYLAIISVLTFFALDFFADFFKEIQTDYKYIVALMMSMSIYFIMASIFYIISINPFIKRKEKEIELNNKKINLFNENFGIQLKNYAANER